MDTLTDKYINKHIYIVYHTWNIEELFQNIHFLKI